MAVLDPTPELLAVARRVATGAWTVGHDEEVFDGMDPNLQLLVGEGHVALWLSSTGLRLDYWTLTQSGVNWLTKHNKETS